jgi:hypothetical protein
VERTTDIRLTNAIEGGSFALSHNLAKAKPASIGDCKCIYNHLSGPSAFAVLHLPTLCARTSLTAVSSQRPSRQATTPTMLNILSSLVELYIFFKMFDNLATPTPAARFTRYLSTLDNTAKVLVYVTRTVDAPLVGVLHGMAMSTQSMTTLSTQAGPSLP